MIGSEVQFGLNNFKEPITLTESESIGQLFKNLLLMRPGQLPSMPHLGIDIKQYLYAFEEELDTEAIKEEISKQAASIMPYVNTDSLEFTTVTIKGTTVFVLMLPINIQNNTKTMVLGMRKNSNNAVVIDYKFEDNL